MRYSGSNVSISFSQVLRENKARIVSVFVLLCMLVFFIIYFYEINRERLEVFDFEITESNPEIALIDSVSIQIYHSYNNEFTVLRKKDADNPKQKEYARKKEPSLSFDVELSLRGKQTLNPDFHKYYSDWIPIDSTQEVVNLPVNNDPVYGIMEPDTYRYFKEVQYRFFSNQKTRSLSTSTVLNETSRRRDYQVHTSEGDSLIITNQYLVAIDYKKPWENTSGNNYYYKHKVSPLVYEGGKDHFPFDVEFKIRNQSNYNIFFRNINIAVDSCQYKEITINFPSSVLCDLVTVEPDRRTATSITYNTEAKIRELQENGLYLNAKPLSNNNYIDTKNFILATIIGGLFSIIADLIISMISERDKRGKTVQVSKESMKNE